MFDFDQRELVSPYRVGSAAGFGPCLTARPVSPEMQARMAEASAKLEAAEDVNAARRFDAGSPTAQRAFARIATAREKAAAAATAKLAREQADLKRQVRAVGPRKPAECRASASLRSAWAARMGRPDR